MATFCKLCGKKLGLFDSRYSADNIIMCDNCYCIFNNVVDSASNFEIFKNNLEEFKNIFREKECLAEAVNFLEDMYKNKIDKVESTKESINGNIGPFNNQDLVYTIEGVRGRHIDVYKNKVVINTKVTFGSLITHNATNGEKTIYYSDCIGIQFKPSKFTIGYIQLETASNSGNNKNGNFFEENSFTFDTTVISNERMTEVADYIKSCIDTIKTTKSTVNTINNNASITDELLKLKQLLDLGVLTQEEFEIQKNKLLNR